MFCRCLTAESKQSPRSRLSTSSTTSSGSLTTPSFKRGYLKIASIDVHSHQFSWSSTGNLVADSIRTTFQPFEDSQSFDAHEILRKQIWVGSIQAAQDIQGLKQRKIAYILTVANKLVDTRKAMVTGGEKTPILDHAVLEIEDRNDVNILVYLKEVLNWIDLKLSQKKGAILIHCAQGVSRSVSVVIAYLMTKKKEPFFKTLEQVQSKRVLANPNSGFRSQLFKYERAGYDLRKAIETHQNRSLALE